MAGRIASRGSDQFMLRMPDGMRERLALRAKTAGRSMNSEIIGLLEKALQDDDTLDELWRKVEKLEDMVHGHDEQLNPGRHYDD